jgi:biopolymer transport protein ExbD
VLLVIFIITAPMFTHAIKLDLPAAQAAPAPEKPATITVSIDGGGRLFWNDKSIDIAEMSTRLETESKKDPQPELQLRADKATRYETIAQVMATAQGSGMTKLGFVTDPKSAGAQASKK